jgi:hypothetical protein
MRDAITYFWADLRTEATDRWHVSASFAGWMFILPLAGSLVLIALAAISRDAFVWFTTEDGPLEWGEVTAWVFALPAIIAMAIHLWRDDNRRVPALMYALLVVGAVFVAGEEISWGQRLLGIDTPQSIARENTQGETTIHNLSAIHAEYRLALFLVGAYGSLFVYLCRGWLRTRWRDGFDLYIPPLFLTSGFLVQALYRGMRLAWYHEPQTELWGFAEWPELWIPLAVGVFAFLNLRRHHIDERSAATEIQAAPVEA